MTAYYVDNSKADDTGDGLTPATAKKTFDAAAVLLTDPGSVLYVMAGTGTYSDDWSVDEGTTGCTSGTSGNHMTVRYYPGDSPLIAGSLTITDIAYWKFDGLNFTCNIVLGKATGTTITSEADNIVFTRCSLKNGTDKNMVLKAATNWTIRDMVFDNLRSRAAGADLTAIATNAKATNGLIENCTFIDIGADGIQFYDLLLTVATGVSNIEVHDIIVRNNQFYRTDPYLYRDENGDVAATPEYPADGFDGSVVGENAIDVKVGYNLTFKNNIYHGFRPTIANQDVSGDTSGCAVVIHNYSGNSLGTDHGHSIVFDGEDFYDNQKALGFYASKSDATDLGNFGVLVKNCRFRCNYRTGGQAITSPAGSGDCFIYIGTSVNTLKFYNNSFDSKDYETRNIIQTTPGDSSLIWRNNAFTNCDTGTIPAGEDWDYSAYDDTVSEDADMVGANDVDVTDLSLDTNLVPSTGSSLYGAGVQLDEVTTDCRGNVRPNPPSIGAFESQAANKVSIINDI